MTRAANRKKQRQSKDSNDIDFPNDFHRIGRPVFGDKYNTLSANARMLLIDFVRQHNGFNNGDMAAVFADMKAFGWKSPVTLSKAIGELLAAGFIARTRYGTRNRCALFGLTFFSLMTDRRKFDPDLVAAFPSDRTRFRPPYLDNEYLPEGQVKAPAIRGRKKNRRYSFCISGVRSDTETVPVEKPENAIDTRGVSVRGGSAIPTDTPAVHLSSTPSPGGSGLGLRALAVTAAQFAPSDEGA